LFPSFGAKEYNLKLQRGSHMKLFGVTPTLWGERKEKNDFMNHQNASCLGKILPNPFLFTWDRLKNIGNTIFC